MLYCRNNNTDSTFAFLLSPTVAKSRGEYLPTHFKNMREVAAALSGMKLEKAYTYLADVKEHKQVIPYRRFAGGIGRASQAKQFKTTKGEPFRFILLWSGYSMLEVESPSWTKKGGKSLGRIAGGYWKLPVDSGVWRS